MRIQGQLQVKYSSSGKPRGQLFPAGVHHASLIKATEDKSEQTMALINQNRSTALELLKINY